MNEIVTYQSLLWNLRHALDDKTKNQSDSFWKMKLNVLDYFFGLSKFLNSVQMSV